MKSLNFYFNINCVLFWQELNSNDCLFLIEPRKMKSHFNSTIIHKFLNL